MALQDDLKDVYKRQPQPRAGGAGAVGVVEGEHPGRQLLDADAAVVAGVVLGKDQILLLPQQIHDDDAAGEVGRRLHGVRQPLAKVGPDDEPVHHDLDVVLLVLLQRDILRQVIDCLLYTSCAAGP